jgi:hypothetical protein
LTDDKGRQKRDPSVQDLWEWISTAVEKGYITSRPSSHCTEVRTVAGKEIIHEKKGGTSNLYGKHFGMNIAVGGEGRQAAVGRGRTAVADGRYGHIFFHYNPPTLDKIGSLMIGIEASGPQKGDQYGSGHGPAAGEQYAAGLGLYWNTKKNPGLDRAAGTPATLPAKYNGMHIRHMPYVKLRQLKGMAAHWNPAWLDQASEEVETWVDE